MAGSRGTERRRQPDRRQGDRRRPPRSTLGDSWLSVWGDSRTSSRRDGGAEADAGGGGDSRLLRREAERLVSGDGAALPRILRTYVIARAALGMALVVAPWVAALLGSRPPLPMMLVALVYASQAVSLWVLRGVHDDAPADRLLPRQWLWTIGIDLLAFVLLRLLDPTGLLNYGALLVLPVLMAGVLTRRVLALGTAAAVALVLLATAWWSSQPAGDLLLALSQAGLSGAGLFLVALLSAELAQRLAREERSARSSLELARQQTQLNRVVIEEMNDGVMVVDRAGTVRTINPAARQLLGVAGQRIALPCPMSGEPVLAGLWQALQQAYVQGNWPESAREQVLPQAEGEGRAVQVRARFTRRSGIAADDTPPEDICVLFIEDLRLLRSRQRQEKLAAMGRMSAGIAHEIRNPLAAIAQANALLLEDDLPPTQQRLTRIVADNVDRLKRIVDDVMAVAPGAAPSSAEIDANAEVAVVVADWRRSAPSSWRADERLSVSLPGHALRVRFDADHLRRVLLNLLDNAVRHAGEQPGAVVLTLRPLTGDRAVLLNVASDGEAIAPEVERHLFEPFFSTRSRGGGLGLYICRELCERYGASIEYRPGAVGQLHVGHRNQFSVVMRRVAAAS
ncbi:two-component system sensor histidine kinase NtrB [Aquabacterium sp. OR-4]|uniref:two-component system sensor histidine kinase NtrB n=1 Tax=Aquabacterium sp. OR-4 TaxID=2978127 RepID=UPI0028C5DF75|nr:ATP-binding protein [Aquabacterium sp. OR-4]MDT7837454.1 ATP-binding protein [Aquabacterium sp. OR-4]